MIQTITQRAKSENFQTNIQEKIPEFQGIENESNLLDITLKYIEQHKEALLDFFYKTVEYLDDLEKDSSRIIDQKYNATNPKLEIKSNEFLTYSIVLDDLKKTLESLDTVSYNSKSILVSLFKLTMIISTFNIFISSQKVDQAIPQIELQGQDCNFLGITMMRDQKITIDKVSKLTSAISNLGKNIMFYSPERYNLIESVKKLEGTEMTILTNSWIALIIETEDIPEDFYLNLTEFELILLKIYTIPFINGNTHIVKYGLPLAYNNKYEKASLETINDNMQLLFKLIQQLDKYFTVEKKVEKKVQAQIAEIQNTQDTNIKIKLLKQFQRTKAQVYRESYNSCNKDWDKENAWNTPQKQNEKKIAKVKDTESEILRSPDLSENILLKQKLTLAITPLLSAAYGSKNSFNFIKSQHLGISQMEFIISLIEFININKSVENLDKLIVYAINSKKLGSKRSHQRVPIMVIGEKMLKEAIKININNDDRIIVYRDQEANQPRIILLTGEEYHNQRKL
ncbi:MAG: hypothetical protein H7196_03835 [candidate division SR1 bacterium]|nr:hypothetical protein [candidate division SR1 bacterium]